MLVVSLESSANDVKVFAKNGISHMAAPSCIPLVSYANLVWERKPIIDIRSNGSKVCNFICAVMGFDNVAMIFDNDMSYREERF